MPCVNVSVRVARKKPSHATIHAGPAKCAFGTFTVDAVYGEDATQKDVFEGAALPLVNGFAQGIDQVMLVYGAQRSGKSHTLEGGAADSAGMIQRAASAVLRYLAVVPHGRYRLQLTCCGLTTGPEPHLLDLTDPSASAHVALRELAPAAALKRLAAAEVSDEGDVREVLRTARAARLAAAHQRATQGPLHWMATLMLRYTGPGQQWRQAHLSFIELAAPEPKDLFGNWGGARGASKPGARHMATSYNSLAAVLMGLRSSAPLGTPARPGTAHGGSSGDAAGDAGIAPQSSGNKHVPWRDSGLTRWLYGRLQSAEHVLVLGTVLPGLHAAADTLATLAFVARLRPRGTQGGVAVSAVWEEAASSAHADVGAEPPHISSTNARVVHAQRLDALGNQPCSSSSSWASSPAAAMLSWPPPSAAAAGRPILSAGRIDGGRGTQGRRPSRSNSPATRRLVLRPQSASGAGAAVQQPSEQPLLKRLALQQHRPAPQAQQARLHQVPGQDAQPGQQLWPDEAWQHPQRHQELEAGLRLAAGDSAAAAADEAAVCGELLAYEREGGGGLRGEALMEQLMEKLVRAREAAGEAAGEVLVLRGALEEADAVRRAGEAAAAAETEALREALAAVRCEAAEATAGGDELRQRVQRLEAAAVAAVVASVAGSRAGSPCTPHAVRVASPGSAVDTCVSGEPGSMAASNAVLRVQLETAHRRLRQLAAGGHGDGVGGADSGVDAVQPDQTHPHVVRLAVELQELREQLQGEAAAKRRAEIALEQAEQALDATAAELAELLEEHARLQAVHQGVQRVLSHSSEKAAEEAASVASLQRQVAELKAASKELQQQRKEAVAEAQRHAAALSRVQQRASSSEAAAGVAEAAVAALAEELQNCQQQLRSTKSDAQRLQGLLDGQSAASAAALQAELAAARRAADRRERVLQQVWAHLCGENGSAGVGWDGSTKVAQPADSMQQRQEQQVGDLDGLPQALVVMAAAELRSRLQRLQAEVQEAWSERRDAAEVRARMERADAVAKDLRTMVHTLQEGKRSLEAQNAALTRALQQQVSARNTPSPAPGSTVATGGGGDGIRDMGVCVQLAAAEAEVSALRDCLRQQRSIALADTVDVGTSSGTL